MSDPLLQPGEQPTGPEKKRRVPRWLLITVAVLVVLWIIGTLTSNTSSKKPAASAPRSAHAVASTSSAAPAQPPGSGKDQTYMSVIAATTGITPTKTQTTEYINLGHDVCKVLHDDQTATEAMVEQEITAHGVPEGLASAIVGAAVGTYCPQLDR